MFYRQAIYKVNRFIDIKMGFLGAMIMGSIVYWINWDHGWILALIASLKQGAYTFFFGGLFLKMAENIAINIAKRWLAVMCGAFIPMLITASLTLGLHMLKGTPEPINSTIPTIFLASLSFGTWSFIKHSSKSPE